MREPEIEVRNAVSNMKDGAAASTISTALFRAFTNQNWTETQPRQRKDIKREYFKRTKHEEWILNTELAENTRQWTDRGMIGPRPQRGVMPEIDVPTHRTIKVQPTRAVELLTMITTLAITECRDLPANQKLSVVTGLPKTGAFLQDVCNLRPISVGPVIGRLIDKIMATRFGQYLASNGTVRIPAPPKHT